MIKDVALWIYWYPVRLIAQLAPLRWLLRVGPGLGWLYHSVARGKKERLLRICDNFDFAPCDDTVRRSFTILMLNELEALVYPKLSTANIGEAVTCEGLEHIDDGLKKGKGVALLFGHFGANQMVMPAIGYRGYTMSQLSAPATVWEDIVPGKVISRMEKRALELRWENELSLPVTHINIFGSLKKAFLCLKRNEVLGVAVDGGGGKKRLRVDFLGGTAFFSTGAVEIAKRAGCVALPTFMVRGDNGVTRMIIEPPLDLEVTGDYDSDVHTALQYFATRFDYYVIKHPCHYINFLALREFMESTGDPPYFAKTLE